MHHIQFVDSVAELPSTAPPDHPHIIDLTTFKENDGDVITDIKLQDAIVTTLHQVSNATLDKFLNSKEAVRIEFAVKSTPGYNCVVIMREGSKVLVGQFVKCPSPRVFEFDNLIRYTIDSTGAWKITYASYRDYFPQDWNEVWVGRAVDVGLGALSFRTTDNDPMRIMMAQQIADYMLAGEYWDSSSRTCTVTSG